MGIYEEKSEDAPVARVCGVGELEGVNAVLHCVWEGEEAALLSKGILLD